MGNDRLVSLTSVPEKIMERRTQGNISGVWRTRWLGVVEEIVFNQYEIAFCNEMTGLVEEGKAVDVVYPDHWKAFSAASHNILIDKLVTYRLGEWTVSWTENWLNYWSQKVVVSSIKSSWRPLLSQGSRIGLMCFHIFVNKLNDRTECTLSEPADDTKLWGAVVLPFRRISTGWRTRQTGTSCNEGQCKILHMERNKPRHQYMLRTNQLESNLAERPGELDTLQGEHEPTKWSCSKEGKIFIRVFPAGWGKWFFPLCSTLERSWLECCVQF